MENFSCIMMAFRRIVKEVREAKRAMETEELPDENIIIHLHYTILVALRFVKLLTKVIPDLKMAEEVLKIRQLVHEFVMIGAKGEFGVTPLHLECSQPIRLLSIPTINLLLECGAPVDERDNDGNTALHTAAIKINHKKSMKVVIQSLLKNGAHPDGGNKNKQRFYDLIVGMPLHEITNSKVPFSLKCLAAQVVRKHDLKLDSLPITLQTIVLNH